MVGDRGAPCPLKETVNNNNDNNNDDINDDNNDDNDNDVDAHRYNIDNDGDGINR